MIIKFFFTTKLREEIHMIACLLKTYRLLWGEEMSVFY